MRRQNIPQFIMLLCLLSLVPGGATTVFCLEGNGAIAIESVHFEGDNPFGVEKPQQPASFASMDLKNCPSNCHLQLLTCTPASQSFVTVAPPFLSERALLADISTGLLQQDPQTSLRPPENHPPPLLQSIMQMESVVLLI